MTEATKAQVRVGLYARVSTADKDQNPETQLMPLREFAQAQGWQPTEYVDYASAGDLQGQKSWTALLRAASRRQLDVILVWKLDRAFRSVVNAATTLEQLRGWNVGFRSYTEPAVDTTTPLGELTFNLLATFAQFEKSMIAQRVRAGMARAKAHGKNVRRPRKAASATRTSVAA